VQKNSSESVEIITSETNNLSNLLLNILQIFSESFTTILIYAFMLVVDYKTTLMLTGVLIICVSVIFNITIRKNKILGSERYEADREMHRTLGATFGNLKFIKLKGNEEQILNSFEASAKKHSHANIINLTLGIMPKTILEFIGFSLISVVIIFNLVYYNSTENVIPILAMYALSMYRILPAIHRLFMNLNNVLFLKKSLDLIYDNINQNTERKGFEPLSFNNSITLKNISFQYNNYNNVLSDVSFRINKGEKIAIVGESGSGKSTLVDIIIGINKPGSGILYIDDNMLTDDNIGSWRKKIGYIPQNIYLFDGTIYDNITFGMTPNTERVIHVLKMTNIWDTLEKKDGLETRVGEGGVQLSGGQKQRIGIARALYNDPDVLVLDEATSALDTETESKIMNEIYKISENKTLIIIAHRLSTIERCDKKIKIQDSNILVLEPVSGLG
jgi:ATP-binding cassette subfamily B protein/ATP-binding cassette subfamily C protein